MRKLSCFTLFLIVLILGRNYVTYSHSHEQFIDPKKYIKTNQNVDSQPKESQNNHSSTNEVFVENIAPTKNSEEFQSTPVPKNTNLNSSDVRKQKALEFATNQEALNAQKRKKNTISDQEALDYGIPLVHKFVPIDAIVLDAGHGGKDPGGVSNGIEEKRLALSLVVFVHKLFRKYNSNIKIYITRKNDQFISLEERVSRTARWSVHKNILFVSVHGNIAYNSKIEGLEIYTLSDRASDPDALATERIENAGFTAEDIKQTSSLYSILADLIRDSTRKQSEWLARYVYDDMMQQAKVYGRGLKRANFFVLKYNTVPSILIEVGYMSNPKEAEKLKDEKYQQKLATGIFKGISRYIKEYNKTEGFTK